VKKTHAFEPVQARIKLELLNTREREIQRGEGGKAEQFVRFKTSRNWQRGGEGELEERNLPDKGGAGRRRRRRAVAAAAHGEGGMRRPRLHCGDHGNPRRKMEKKEKIYS